LQTSRKILNFELKAGRFDNFRFDETRPDANDCGNTEKVPEDRICIFFVLLGHVIRLRVKLGYKEKGIIAEGKKKWNKKREST
jgi:hypothetical protein